MSYIWAYKVILDLNDSKEPKEEFGFIHAGDSFKSAVEVLEEYYQEELNKIVHLECIQEGDIVTIKSVAVWECIKSYLDWDSEFIVQ